MTISQLPTTVWRLHQSSAMALPTRGYLQGKEAHGRSRNQVHKNCDATSLIYLLPNFFLTHLFFQTPSLLGNHPSPSQTPLRVEGDYGPGRQGAKPHSRLLSHDRQKGQDFNIITMSDDSTHITLLFGETLPPNFSLSISISTFALLFFFVRSSFSHFYFSRFCFLEVRGFHVPQNL